MAARGVQQAPPYNAVLWIALWLSQFAGYVRGRCLLSGVDVRSLNGAQLIDVGHALMAEGLDPDGMLKLDDAMERAGHEFRANRDSRYKRRTWGRRPEDMAQIAELQADMAGRRR